MTNLSDTMQAWRDRVQQQHPTAVFQKASICGFAPRGSYRITEYAFDPSTGLCWGYCSAYGEAVVLTHAVDGRAL